MITVPVVLTVGETRQVIGQFRVSDADIPPTRAQIATMLHEVANRFAGTPDGVIIPSVVTILTVP